MNRRQFLASSALTAPALSATRAAQNDLRGQFPRLEHEVFVNAAAGTPLGQFAEAGLRRYLEYQRLGPGSGRRDYVDRMHREIRELFAELVGATAAEIALVHCTKAGEQLVIDSLPKLRRGANIVTNDLHFSGSLHNLIGLRGSGIDVRIVRHRNWHVPLEAMDRAIDRHTALVAVTSVSNVNGYLSPLRELSEIAHSRGALLYADIIQGAGIVPTDLRASGVDFAACSAYKWLYAVHGVGFLFVKREHQGTILPDRLFPGHVQPNYEPWVDAPDPAKSDFGYTPRTDASRYEPGHVSYLGYCAAYEGLRLLHRVGVDRALSHSVALNQRLKQGLDAKGYDCISPDLDRSPILTFVAKDGGALDAELSKARVVVSRAGDRVRVSPALYNHEADIDRLVECL